MAISYTTTTRSKLQRMFDTCIISEEKYSEVDYCIKQIVKGKARYEAVSEPFSLPWYLTGIIHSMSCDCDFKVHLHNGDPLNGRTVNIPTGYPKKGRPPFTWEQSAEDLLLFYRLDKWSDWSIPGMLFILESINGNSHNDQEIEFSRLWCYSNHYTPKATDTILKCGGAILLRRMAEKHLIPIEIDYNARLKEIIRLGSEVQFMPNRSLGKIFELQRLLNLSGAYLREDGRAGKYTAIAFHSITHQFLSGDPDMVV